MKIRISLEARRDIKAAVVWWHANRPAARDLLAHELRLAFELLPAAPRAGAPALNVEAQGVRRLYLKETRYFLYYSAQGEVIEILRLWHASRGSSPR